VSREDVTIIIKLAFIYDMLYLQIPFEMPIKLVIFIITNLTTYDPVFALANNSLNDNF